jgi:hypothetical protein
MDVARDLIRLQLALVIDGFVDAVTDVPRVELVCVLRHRRLTAVSGFFAGRLVLAALVFDDAVVLLRDDVLLWRPYLETTIGTQGGFQLKTVRLQLLRCRGRSRTTYFREGEVGPTGKKHPVRRRREEKSFEEAITRKRRFEHLSATRPSFGYRAEPNRKYAILHRRAGVGWAKMRLWSDLVLSSQS